MKIRLIILANVLGVSWLAVSATTMICMKAKAQPVFDENAKAEGVQVGPPGEARFVIWGDSHAGALRSLFGELATKYDIPGKLFAGRGLVPLQGVHNPHAAISAWDQEERSRHIVSWIRDNKIPRVFIVSRWECHVPRWTPQFTDPDLLKEWKSRMIADEDTEAPSIEDSARVLQTWFRATLINLNDTTVYFVMQSPVKDGLCGDQPVSEETYALQQREILSVLGCLPERIADRRYAPLTHMPDVLGPGKWWFKNGMSVTRDDGGEYYGDRHHVSSHGADKLYRPLLEPVFRDMAKVASVPVHAGDAKAAGR